jgi:hypothetical protein
MTEVLHEPFLELVALTQLYILQEHGLNEKIHVNGEYLKEYKAFKPISVAQSPLTAQPKPSPAVLPPPPKAPVIIPKAPTLSKEILPEQKSVEIPIELAKANSFSQQAEKSFLNLEPLKSLPSSDFNDIKSIISEKFPSQRFVEPLALKIPKILVLAPVNHSGQQTFLKHLTLAIDRCIGPAIYLDPHQMEIQWKWDQPQLASLKWVLADQTSLDKISGNQKEKLFTILLEDFELYLREPQRKAFLWTLLRNQISL